MVMEGEKNAPHGVRRRYVEVTAEFSPEGKVTPLSITWEDGRVFEIDRVEGARRAASLKAGGTGIRYTIMVRGRRTFLYFEGPAWFVEERARR